MALTYTRANEQLTGRCSERRKLGNNTYLERHEDHIAVRLHGTDILSLYPDGRIVYNTGGWRTRTTKQRMNEYGPLRLWQERGEWHFRLGEGTAIYADGMVYNDGAVTGAEPVSKAKDALKLRRRVQQFAAKYMKAFRAGKVPAPSGGDCFYCAMRTVDGGVPLGEALRNRPCQAPEINSSWPVNSPQAKYERAALRECDHILSHIEENYFVPSLLWRASEVMPVSQVAKWTLAEMWGEPQMDRLKLGGLTDIATKQLQKALSRYLLRQIGQAS